MSTGPGADAPESPGMHVPDAESRAPESTTMPPPVAARLVDEMAEQQALRELEEQNRMLREREQTVVVAQVMNKGIRGFVDLRDPHERRKRLCIMAVVLIVVCSVIVGLVLGLTFGLTSGNDDSAPPLAPEIPRVDQVSEFLVKYGVSDLSDILEVDSPQHMAVMWLADQDARELEIPDALESPEGVNFISRYVAALLYFSLGGPGWVFQLSFLSEKQTCDWNDIFSAENEVEGIFFRVGVTCNYGIVNTLQIPGNGLEGTIPSEVRFLTNLRIMAFNSNKIEGTIPSALKMMRKLDYLALQGNKLEGSLPPWMGDFNELRVIGLGDNNLEGTIPMEIGKLSNLVTLGLDNNKFNGGFAALKTCTNLRRVYLENNDFDTTLNDVFTTMTDLQELDLSSNRIEGIIPEYLFRFSMLRILDLHDNELDGELPAVIPFNPALTYFGAHDNLLEGTIPSALGNLGNLTHLDLSSNKFLGDIPTRLQELTNLKYLFLSENSLLEPGPIPTWIATSLLALEDLSLRNMARTGDIPSSLGELQNLTLLDLHHNELSGPIPRQIGELTKLRFLLLSRNNLTGTIPADFELLTSLDMLLLNSNSLTGTAEGMCTLGIVPSVFGADCVGDNPEIKCECCSLCCLDTDDECSEVEALANLDPIWENSFERQFYEFGADLIYEKRL